MFEKITKWSTYALFFLLPLFFLPWTTSVLEQNKQLLLVVLTILGLAAWLGQMVVGKRLSFRTSWLNVVPGVFLIAVLVSAATSYAGYQSWVGQASQEYMSFLSMALFVGLFYLLMNTAGETKLQRSVFFSLLVSAALVGLIGLLSVFNLVQLPFDFSQTRGFNPVGTINSLVVFLSVVMFTGMAMWLTSQQGRDRVIPIGTQGTIQRALIVAVTVINLLLLVVVDFWVFWVINIFGVLLLAVFGFVQSQEFPQPKKFALPLAVLVVSVVLLFLPTPLRLQLPITVSPSYGTSWDITQQALKSSTSNLLFGTGPGTYQHDYLAYKPASVNASQFWSLRFDRAKSFVQTALATYGVLGTLLWLVVMGWVAVKAVGRLVFERDHEEWKMTYVVFAGWAVLLLAHVLYSSNMTLQFMMWGLTGLLASQVFTKMWNTDFARAPKLGLAASAVFALLGVGFLGSLFVTGQRYAADVAFAKGVRADQAGESIDVVAQSIQTAVNFNGLSDIYLRNLAAAQLGQARAKIAEFRALGTELTTEQQQEITALVTSAVNASMQATKIEPNNVSNWVVRGAIYRDLMSFAQGAEDLASQMYLNAVRLEPNNPVHRVNLGRVYLAVADRARALKSAENKELAASATQKETELLQGAENTFNSAIQLKQDYLPAHYYLSAVYERQGRLQEATERMAAIRNQNLNDIGVAFQLSQMLIRLQRYDLATQELERIVGLNPNYSNALWYLASMYEINKKPAEATALVQKVVELNPDNEAAKARLANMKAGKLTTQIPEPIQADQTETTEVPQGEIVEDQPVAEEPVE